MLSNSSQDLPQYNPLEHAFLSRAGRKALSSVSLILQIHPGISSYFRSAEFEGRPGEGNRSLHLEVKHLLEEMNLILGVPIPDFQIIENDGLDTGEFAIGTKDRVIYRDRILTEHIWASADEDMLDSLGIVYDVFQNGARHPVTGFSAAWIPEGQRSKIERKGIVFKSIPEYILFTLSEVVWNHSFEFIEGGEVEALIDKVKQSALGPSVQIYEDFDSTERILEVLRRLLQQKVPVHRLGEILSEMNEMRTCEINSVAERILDKFKNDEILLEVSEEIGFFVYPEQDSSHGSDTEHEIDHELLPMMHDALFYDLGVSLPGVDIEINKELEPDTFQIRVNSITRSVEKVLLNHVLGNYTVDQLDSLPVEGIPAMNPANGSVTAWVPEERAKELGGKSLYSGWDTWDIAGYLVLSLSAALRRCAADFVGINEVEYSLDQLSMAFPRLVEVVKQEFTIDQITVIMRNLVREGISVRDLRSILESLSQCDLIRRNIFTLYSEDYPATPELPRGKRDLTALTEYVRAGLKSYISHKYTRGQNALIVYLLDTEIEKLIRDSIRETEYGSRLEIEDSMMQKILKAVGEELSSPPHTAQMPAILTDMSIRPHFRNLVAFRFPNLHVLSYQELSPFINVQPLARIGLS